LQKSTIKEALPFFALFNLALQPLYSSLVKFPEFFVFHNLRNLSLIMLVFSLSFLAPFLIFLLYLLAEKFGSHFQHGFRAFVFAALTTLILSQPVRSLDFSAEILVIACFFLCSLILFSIGYRKVIPSYLLFLSPAILLVPGMFLFNPQIKKLYNAETPISSRVAPKNSVPLVIVVFDEFPLVALLNKDLNIDSHLFPNFYELSQNANFYRNATTSADETTFSIPTILTGRYGHTRKIPVPFDYPNTLFTLLQDSYSMQATEFATQLFPNKLRDQKRSSNFSEIISDLSIVYGHVVLPSVFTKNLPSIQNNWGNFAVRQNQIRSPDHRAGRRKTFDDFLSSLKADNKPTLNYLHILLPHRIWEYLPSGRIYDPFEIENIALVSTTTWENETVLKESYQRLLLQVQFLDGLIADLIQNLKTKNLYDSSMIILVGDHGLGLTEGAELRKVQKKNYPEMLWVPLFIKFPNQKTGRTLDWNVETVDILPTIAEVLDFSIPWKVDGFSLMKEPSRTIKSSFLSNQRVRRNFSPDLRQIQRSVDRKIKWFGEEASANLFFPGSDQFLMGRPATSNVSTVDARIEIHKAERFQNLDSDSSFIPALLSGTIESAQLGENKMTIAVALNGAFQATVETRPLRKKGIHSFRVMLPESAFVKGYNTVQIYLRGAHGKYVLLESSETTIAKVESQ
jgi:hypothetical protein